MRQWRAANITMRCGFDWDHRIGIGEWYLALILNDGQVHARCRTCALQRYGATPEDIPTTAETITSEEA